jgi:hypothetical protein
MLLFLGLELWFLVMHGLGVHAGQWTILGIVAVLAIIPQVARNVARVLDRVRRPSQRAAGISAAVVFVISIAFLYLQAASQHRDFGLRYQDEYSYRIQTLMAARGKLWEPAHPLPEFFESFQLIATPVYGSIYFPGTAMLFAPGVWLHLAHWVIPLIAAAGVIALVYAIFTELIDGIAGLLGALLVASNPIFREMSIMVIGEVPAVLGAMLLVWSYLRWQKSRNIGMAIVMGIFAGWLAITRPVDALTIIVPVGIGVLLNLRQLSWGRRSAIVFAGIAGFCPFLIIQLIFNAGVTGRLTETPFDFYTRQVYPLATYGFHGDDPTIRPTWPLAQVQQAYDELSSGLLHDHTVMGKLIHWPTAYLPDTVRNVVPHTLLVMLVPVGVLGLKGRRWLLAAMLPLFVLLYFPYVFFIRHYAVIVIPAGIMMIVLGVHVLSDFSPRLRPHVQTFLVLGIVALLVSSWPAFNRTARDEYMPADALRSIDARLANLPHTPAIVLFHFTPGDQTDLEPVYNAEVVWPDDANVIRAHDLGDKNVELFKYYVQRQPSRWVYLYTLRDGTLVDLGPVTKLAAGSP